MKCRYANLFLHAVREDDAPGYKDVVHRPMDLSSIKRSIENGVRSLSLNIISRASENKSIIGHEFLFCCDSVYPLISMSV